jgi:hypothetical protein
MTELIYLMIAKIYVLDGGVKTAPHPTVLLLTAVLEFDDCENLRY